MPKWRAEWPSECENERLKMSVIYGLVRELIIGEMIAAQPLFPCGTPVLTTCELASLGLNIIRYDSSLCSAQWMVWGPSTAYLPPTIDTLQNSVE